MKFYFGCSGYFYWHWKGKFYPENMEPRDFFDFYQRKFDTVEINSSFYNFPKDETVKKWYKQAREGFVYSVKVNRMITHMKKFVGTENLVKDFYKVAKILEEKLACVLFQLPPSLKFDLKKLEKILGQLNSEFKNVMEFRHKSWWNQEVKERLKENNVSFCVVSAKNLPENFVKTSKIVYVRFHGKEWYRYSYSNKELKAWADEILKGKAKENYIYFNNDFNAYAPENCLAFKEIISGA